MGTAELTLESLGLDQDSLATKLVDRLAQNMLTSIGYDADGDEWFGTSPFARKLNDMVKARLDSVVNDLADKHVLPRVEAMVEGLVLQQTNQWGEKVGSPVTFIEYLTHRADVWMREEVNYDGKTKGENGGFSWTKKGTRVAYLIDRHLQYNIENAMKAALCEANKSIVAGINEAVKIKLGQIAVQLKTEIKDVR